MLNETNIREKIREKQKRNVEKLETRFKKFIGFSSGQS